MENNSSFIAGSPANNTLLPFAVQKTAENIEQATSFFTKMHADLVASPQLLKNSTLVEKLKNDDLIKHLKENQNLFAHALLSARIKDTEYEGIHVDRVIHWDNKVINFVNANSNDLTQVGNSAENLKRNDELLVTFNNYTIIHSDTSISIQAEAKRIAENIQKLNIGESYCIPSGFSFNLKAGHTIFIRFQREKEDQFKIIVYDGNSVYLQSHQKTELGDKNEGKVIYANVTSNDLFFSSEKEKMQTGIFESLVELRVLFGRIKGENEDLEFNHDDVYKIFAHIQHKIQTTPENHSYRTIQRNNTCSQKSFNSLLQDYYDRKSYKTHIFNSKLLALVNMYHAYSENLGDSNEDISKIRIQLREGALNMCQKMCKYLSQKEDYYPFFSEEQAIKYYATLLDILEKLDHCETEAQQKMQRVPFNIDGFENIPAINLKKLHESINSSSTAIFSNQIITHVSNPSSIQPQNFTDSLSSFKSRLDKLKSLSNEKLRVMSEIESFFENLPVPLNSFWSKIPLEKATLLSSIDVLYQIFREYSVYHSSQNSLNNFERYNTVMMCMAVMHKLCLLYDKNYGDNTLKNFGICYSHFQTPLLNDSFLISKNYKEWVRHHELLDYFTSVHKRELLFNYKEAKTITDKSLSYELEFWGKLLEKHLSKLQALEVDPETNKFLNSFRQKDLTNSQIKGTLALSGLKAASYVYEQNPHLDYLKKMAIETLMCMGFGKNLKFEVNNELIVHEGEFILRGGTRQFVKPKDEKNYQKSAKSLVSQNIIESLKAYDLLQCLSRDSSKQITESQFLIKKSCCDEKKAKYLELLSLLSTPDSIVSGLLYKLKNHFDWLEDPVIRELVIRILVQPTISEDESLKPTIPLYESLKHNPTETLKLFREFIDQGLAIYLHQQNINLSIPLFLTKLAHIVEKNNKSINEQNNVHLYQETIQDDFEIHACSENGSFAQLLNVFLHQMDKILLNEPENWTAGQWKRLFSNWMSINSLSSIELSNEIDITLLHEIQIKMMKIASVFSQHLDTDPILADEILNSILNKLKISNTKLKWEKHKESLTFFNEKLNVQLNLSSGKVIYQDKLLTNQSIDTNHKNYKAVFDKRKVKNLTYGVFTGFEDVIYGHCRIKDNNLDNGIQREVKQDSWYAYVPVEKVKTCQLKIPAALLVGYTHWMREVNGQFHMLIFDTKSKIDRYEINHLGQISEINNNLLKQLPQDKHGTIYLIEQSDFVICKENGNELLIEFPRYKARDGKCLTFKKKKGQNLWFCAHDPEYYLTDQILYLGSFVYFLNLKHKDGNKQKIIIPNFYSTDSKSFSNKVKVFLDTYSECGSTFFEYHIVDGKPIAATTEGWLVLAQIYFAQKNYQKAVECLDKITKSESDELTIVSKKICSQLVNSIKNINDESPNACAIRLRAFLILNLNSFPNIEYQELIALLYETYLNGINNVIDNLKLNKQQEFDLIRLLPRAFSERETFLKSNTKFATNYLIKEIPKYCDLNESAVQRDSSLFIDSLSDRRLKEILNKLTEKKQRKLYYEVDFMNCYKILTTGSDAERRNLIFKLQWRISKINKLSPQAATLLHFVYKYPNLAPALPDNNDKMLEWLFSLLQNYKKGIENESANNYFNFEHQYFYAFNKPIVIQKSNNNTHSLEESPLITSPASEKFEASLRAISDSSLRPVDISSKPLEIV